MNTPQYSPDTLAMFAACERIRASFSEADRAIYKQRLETVGKECDAERALKIARANLAKARRAARIADRAFLSTEVGQRYRAACLADYRQPAAAA